MQFHFSNKITKSGFTLIEVILYSFLLSSLLVIFINFSLQVSIYNAQIFKDIS